MEYESEKKRINCAFIKNCFNNTELIVIMSVLFHNSDVLRILMLIWHRDLLLSGISLPESRQYRFKSVHVEVIRVSQQTLISVVFTDAVNIFLLFASVSVYVIRRLFTMFENPKFLYMISDTCFMVLYTLA